ncbi:MAG: 4'-phosphopantetheinyl transferase family protein, partial [Candidatus Heimdallarchaeaceae archaeon]
RIANERRKTEYLAGVIAAKELYTAVEPLADFRDVEIKKRAKGQPYFYNRLTKQESDWKLSISHSNDFAIAAISKEPIGVDIEKIEERKPSFYREVFTEREQQEISQDKLMSTKYWTAKEAVTKALGEGLHVNLHDIEISQSGNGKLAVRLSSKLQDFEGKSFNIRNSVSTNYSISHCTIKKE